MERILNISQLSRINGIPREKLRRQYDNGELKADFIDAKDQPYFLADCEEAQPRKEVILYNGVEFPVDDLDGDLPPQISAAAMGCSQRSISNFKRATGGDYYVLKWKLVNRPGVTRSPIERQWIRDVSAWANRQGL